MPTDVSEYTVVGDEESVTLTLASSSETALAAALSWSGAE
jgi:hypothetical protein